MSDYDPEPPYAVLVDGSKEPLQNCPFCKELGLSRFAHMHVCSPTEQLRSMLDRLLAFVHRDDGQYTALAGIEVSVADAAKIVQALHKDNAALKARLKKLTHE